MKNESIIDPSLPDFHYGENDRVRMEEEGLSEQEINEKEARIRLDMAEKQFQKELDEANKDLPEDERIRLAA